VIFFIAPFAHRSGGVRKEKQNSFLPDFCGTCDDWTAGVCGGQDDGSHDHRAIPQARFKVPGASFEDNESWEAARYFSC